MIVKNKKEILDHANEISNKFLYLIEKETKKFLGDEDAASRIYFNIYCIGTSMAKIALGTERFCQMYGTDKLDSNSVVNWINEVVKEIIEENSKNVH